MSQSRDNLLQKLQDAVEAFPDVQVLIMAVINEKIPYGAPKRWTSLKA